MGATGISLVVEGNLGGGALDWGKVFNLESEVAESNSGIRLSSFSIAYNIPSGTVNNG